MLPGLLTEDVNRDRRRVGKRFVDIVKDVVHMAAQIIVRQRENSVVRLEVICYQPCIFGLVKEFLVAKPNGECVEIGFMPGGKSGDHRRIDAAAQECSQWHVRNQSPLYGCVEQGS